MPSPAEIRKQITEQIVTALESNVVPWRRPWSLSPNAGRAANLVSKRPYSGINPLLLELHSLRHGLRSRWWGTFDQIKELGGVVRKRPDDVPPGQWGCRIVFLKPIAKTVTDIDTGEEQKKQFRLMRTYTVFSVDQADGEALDKYRVVADQDKKEIYPDFAKAEALIEATKAEIRQGGNRACYVRPQPEDSWPNHTFGDYIEVPARRQFPDQVDFWATLLHEMAHFREVRIGWDHAKEGYAAGELVAEMGACILATELGIPQGDDLKNHASYLRHWLDAMQDSTLIFRAASQACKVCDFLLQFVRRPDAEEPEPVVAKVG